MHFPDVLGNYNGKSTGPGRSEHWATLGPPQCAMRSISKLPKEKRHGNICFPSDLFLQLHGTYTIKKWCTIWTSWFVFPSRLVDETMVSFLVALDVLSPLTNQPPFDILQRRFGRRNSLFRQYIHTVAISTIIIGRELNDTQCFFGRFEKNSSPKNLKTRAKSIKMKELKNCQLHLSLVGSKFSNTIIV